MGKYISLIFIFVCIPFYSQAAEKKMRVNLKSSEERWVTFADGGKYKVGAEISPMLLSELESTAEFLLFQNRPENSHFELSIELDQLLYLSGNRSNRIGYGFTAGSLNPFNAGRKGEIGNEFTAKTLKEGDSCKHLDFFLGQVDPTGGGVRRSNFGATFDGIKATIPKVLNAGYKYKSFRTSVEGKVYIKEINTGLRWQVPFKLNLKGVHYMLLLKVAKINIEVEAYVRASLRKSIADALPQFVEHITPVIKSRQWSTKVIQKIGKQYLINAGSQDGLLKNEKLVDASGKQYLVKQLDKYLAKIEPTGKGSLQVGSVLRELGVQQQLALSDRLESINIEKIDEEPRELDDPELLNNRGKCFGQKQTIWEEIMEEIHEPLGMVRYYTVFNKKIPNKESSLRGPRIAVVGSGIYPFDEELEQSVSSTGHDFISFDNRASDDLGFGTAVSHYLVELMQPHPISLIPIKVLGPLGETTSSAIYVALKHVAERKDIDEVLIAFAPSFQSEAFTQGIERILRSGKRVIMPATYPIEGSHGAKRASRLWIGEGLSGAKLRLSLVSRGVVEEASKQYLKTYYNK